MNQNPASSPNPRRVYVKLNFKAKDSKPFSQEKQVSQRTEKRAMTNAAANRTPSPRLSKSPCSVRNRDNAKFEEDRCILLTECPSGSISPAKKISNQKPPRTPLGKKSSQSHSRSSSGNNVITPMKSARNSRLDNLSKNFQITKDMLQRWISDKDLETPAKALSLDFNEVGVF
ncbi:unnamed protein product [Blepharisma stoltei]|uniref:Uncharacterized protein n=1 Tax=Blepharisma stoltei TaxID=1481888 RepID=A0AAU9IE39_9CILI|nr:unnamed protein product [Blepharisma stoltei]